MEEVTSDGYLQVMKEEAGQVGRRGWGRKQSLQKWDLK